MINSEIIEDTPYGFIYITTNIVNNNKYIGQRKYDNKGRWKTYLGSGVRLNNAIKKYGKENFIREIILIGYSKEELNDAEVHYIKTHNAVDSDDYYNLIPGGGSGNPFSGKTEEEILNIKQRMKDGWANKSEEEMILFRKKVSENHADVSGKNNPMYGRGDFISGETHFMYGKHLSDDTKEKIRQARIGTKLSDDHKRKISIANSGEGNHNYGKHLSDETKDKIRISNTGKEISKESREKMRKNSAKARYVILVNTHEIFKTLTEGSLKYNTCVGQITKCCSKKWNAKSAGKHPETGEPLVWMYYEDWLSQQPPLDKLQIL